MDDFHCEFHHRSTNVFVHWTELCHYVANTTAKDAFIVNEEGDFLSFLLLLILYTQYFSSCFVLFPLLTDVELNECEENNETTDYRKLFFSLLYIHTHTHASYIITCEEWTREIIRNSFVKFMAALRKFIFKTKNNVKIIIVIELVMIFPHELKCHWICCCCCLQKMLDLELD